VKGALESQTSVSLSERTGLAVQTIMPIQVNVISLSPQPPPSPNSPVPKSKGGLSRGAVIGIAVGASVGGLIVIVIVILALYKQLSAQVAKKPISVVVKQTSDCVTSVPVSVVSSTSAASPSNDTDIELAAEGNESTTKADAEEKI